MECNQGHGSLLDLTDGPDRGMVPCIVVSVARPASAYGATQKRNLTQVCGIHMQLRPREWNWPPRGMCLRACIVVCVGTPSATRHCACHLASSVGHGSLDTAVAFHSRAFRHPFAFDTQMGGAASKAMSVDAAVPVDNDRRVLRSAIIIFRKARPGEVSQYKAPSREELEVAYKTITKKYGSFVLTTNVDHLGHIPGSRFYEAGEKAWKWMYDHSFYAQWSDEEWVEWREEWLRKRYHKWSEEEWRQWRADRFGASDRSITTGPGDSAAAGDDAGRQGQDRQRSRSPRARASASSTYTYDADGNIVAVAEPCNAGAGPSGARTGGDDQSA